MTKRKTSNVAIDTSRIGGEAPIIVNQILENCLYSGFFGTLDSARIKRVTDKVIAAAEESESDFLIVDMANVDMVDSAVAAHLVKVADTLFLVGTTVVFCGIKSVIAQSMINAGINIRSQKVCRNLKSAVVHVLELQNLKIVSTEAID